MKTVITEAVLQQMVTDALKSEMIDEGAWDAFKNGVKTAWNSRNNVTNYTTDSGAQGAVRSSGGFINRFKQGYNQQMANDASAEAQAQAEEDYRKDMEFYAQKKKEFEELTKEIQQKYGSAGKNANGRYDIMSRTGKDAYIQGRMSKAAQPYANKAASAAQAAQNRQRKIAQRNATAISQGNIQ